jgi:hypothetical protein
MMLQTKKDKVDDTLHEADMGDITKVTNINTGSP